MTTPRTTRPTDDLDSQDETALKAALLREDIRARRHAAGRLYRSVTPITALFSSVGTVLALLVTWTVASSSAATQQLEALRNKAEALKLTEEVTQLRKETQRLGAEKARVQDEVRRIEARRDAVTLNLKAATAAGAKGSGVAIALRSDTNANAVGVTIDSHPQGAMVSAYFTCRGDFAFPEGNPVATDCYDQARPRESECGVTPCKLGTFSRLPYGGFWVQVDFGSHQEWRHVNISPSKE